MVKNKIYLSIFLLVIHLQVGSALLINPSAISINSSFTETATFKLNLINNHNFTLYNLTFNSDKLVPFSIGNILPNQTREITFTTRNLPVGNYNENVNILTFVKFSCSILQNKVHKISLFSNQFGLTQMCTGDSIEFKNTYNFPITLKIYKSNGQEFISQDIPVNGTYTTPQFTTIENYYFTGNFNSLFHGDLAVSSVESLAHDQLNDASFNLKLSVIPKNTSLTMSSAIDSYTINYNESRTGFFSITNTGSYEALNIILSGEWFIFSENNFNLQPGDVKAVNYRIQPIIQSESETNKVYNRNKENQKQFGTGFCHYQRRI
jgi:hypothetical protein